MITPEHPSPPQFRIRLVGWRANFKTITAVQYIRICTRLNLSESKRCVDDCLAGVQHVLIPKSQQDARTLAVNLHRCGAVVSLE